MTRSGNRNAPREKTHKKIRGDRSSQALCDAGEMGVHDGGHNVIDVAHHVVDLDLRQARRVETSAPRASLEYGPHPAENPGLLLSEVHIRGGCGDGGNHESMIGLLG